MRKDGDERKLGEVLAERIENEIISSGWVVGTFLGNENDLMEKYGVSRSVFREAIRIVDYHGVAEMRRGPFGGLVVGTPDFESVARPLSLQLRFERITAEQVLEARRSLEITVARLAATRITADGRRQLEALLDAERQRMVETREHGRPHGDLPTHDFHVLLADLCGNPALALFVKTVNRVLGEMAPKAESLDEMADTVHRVHVHIARAVLDGDAEAAARRMARHLASVDTYFREP